MRIRSLFLYVSDGTARADDIRPYMGAARIRRRMAVELVHSARAVEDASPYEFCFGEPRRRGRRPRRPLRDVPNGMPIPAEYAVCPIQSYGPTPSSTPTEQIGSAVRMRRSQPVNLDCTAREGQAAPLRFLIAGLRSCPACRRRLLLRLCLLRRRCRSL